MRRLQLGLLSSLLALFLLGIPAPGWSASDRGSIQAVLVDAARKLRWSTSTFRPGGTGSSSLGISPTGRDGDYDRVVIVFDQPEIARGLLEQFETNGLPREEFHGKPATIARQGQRLCDLGGTAGFIMGMLKLMVQAVFPKAPDHAFCAEATGTVAWMCGGTLFIVNSTDADDNSRAVAEVVYSRAEARGLCGREIAWSKVKAKLAKKKRLNTCEFLVFIKKIEELNPDMGWQQNITALHHGIYAADTHLSFFGIDLFVDGAENAGWERVILPQGSPKFIQTTEGDVIDMGHAYAGLRAALNRNRGSSWFMSRVNTEWGDKTQVYQERVEGAAGWAWGQLRWAKNQLPFVGTDEGEREANEYINKSKAQVRDAEKFLPPDQKVGNQGGLYLRSWFISNKKGKLSDAWRAWFNSIGEKC